MKKDLGSFARSLVIVSIVSLICASALPENGRASKLPDPAGKAPFRVEVVGHGKPMILIPGLASSGATWSGTVEHFKQRYTCYVLTLAGFAGVPPIQPPLLSKVRDGLAAMIRQRHLTRPVGRNSVAFIRFALPCVKRRFGKNHQISVSGLESSAAEQPAGGFGSNNPSQVFSAVKAVIISPTLTACSFTSNTIRP